jgi:hypothetical protein
LFIVVCTDGNLKDYVIIKVTGCYNLKYYVIINVTGYYNLKDYVIINVTGCYNLKDYVIINVTGCYNLSSTKKSRHQEHKERTEWKYTCRKKSPSSVDRYKHTRWCETNKVQRQRGSDKAQGVLIPFHIPLTRLL